MSQSAQAQFAATRAIHDLLLELAPEGAEHDPLSCGLCTATDLEDQMTTFTQEELAAEVDKATAGLQTQVRELMAKLGESESAAAIEAAVAEATGPLETKIAELTADLDAKAAEIAALAAIKEQHDTLVAELESLESARVENEAAQARRDERIAAAREAAPFFTDEDVEKRADEWASLEDAAFTARLDEYRELATKFDASSTGGDTGTTKVPAKTAMTASSDDPANSGGGSGRVSAVKEAFALRGTALAPKSLR